jgi:hypothetical protein
LRRVSVITSNNCKSCGMPFTMEGTTLEAAGSSNGFCCRVAGAGDHRDPASCAMIPRSSQSFSEWSA